jgi:hypothetical protein
MIQKRWKMVVPMSAVWFAQLMISGRRLVSVPVLTLGTSFSKVQALLTCSCIHVSTHESLRDQESPHQSAKPGCGHQLTAPVHQRH